jgi:hypothetical protein
MPARLERIYDTPDLHFLTFRCYGRRPQLGAAMHKDLFLPVLEHGRAPYCFL